MFQIYLALLRSLSLQIRYRLLIPFPPQEEPAVGFFAAFHAIGAPSAPLFEEKGNILLGTLLLDAYCPFRVHRPGFGATFTTYDNPMDTV